MRSVSAAIRDGEVGEVQNPEPRLDEPEWLQRWAISLFVEGIFAYAFS